MLVEQFAQNEARMQKLFQAIGILEEINFFSVMLEEGHVQNPKKLDTAENAALRGAWGEGFYQCVNHFANFYQIYKQDKKLVPRPEFGARDRLIDNKVMTPEEYERATSRK